MTLDKYVNRLRQVNQLIRQQRTGTPKQFAEKLNLSERQMYNLIEDLKIQEVPIAYCRVKQSYYYFKPVDLRISIRLINLSTEESTDIMGGTNYFQKISPLQFNFSNLG